MITAPQAFIDQIESGNRDYQMLVTCTLASGTVLTFQNDRIWSGGYSYEDAVSTDPDTLEVGTAIINKLTLVINNMDEAYSSYDFGDAVLEVQIGLREDAESSTSYIDRGIYTVSDASYDTSLITLEALDNMYKFDTLYSTIPQVPSTALAIVQDACTNCGVTLGVQTFDGASTAITVAPTKDTTYRQMLAWIGQMVGCDWRINTSGELVPLWYDLSDMDDLYQDGEFIYDGESGYFVIKSLSTANVAIDDTIITGITLRVENQPVEPEPEEREEESPAVTDAEPESAEAFTDYSTGTSDFIVLVEGNPLITSDNAQSILSVLAERLIGMRYRKGQLMHLSDPRLEAGDVFVYADHKGHAYPMICSQTIFSLGDYQTTTSASANPLRKAAERYSAQAQTTVQIYKSVFRERTLREQAEADLQEQLDNASGLYMTTESDGSGGTIYNLHDRPTKAESNIIWRMSASAVGVSTNGGQSYNAGLTADGTAIVQRLYSNTITAGIIQSPDYAYTSGNFSSAGMLVDLAHNVIRTPSFAVVGGNTYISTSLTLGGANNQNGTLTVKNASGTTVGTWDNTGISANAGTIGPLHITPTLLYSGTATASYTGTGIAMTYGDSSILPHIYVGDAYGYSDMTSSGISVTNSNAYDHAEMVDGRILLRMVTSATVTTPYDNPSITFSNSDSSQRLWLVFTDYDVVQAPASLTLAGNQGGEYFIAPNIKASNGSRSVTLKTDGTRAGIYDENQNNYLVFTNAGDTWMYLNRGDIYSSGIYCGTKILRTDGTLRAGTGTAPYTNVNKGNIEVFGASGAVSYVAVYGGGVSNGNQIYLQCESDGRVTLGSRGANGSWYTILRRDNNAYNINAYGYWNFDGSIWVGDTSDSDDRFCKVRNSRHVGSLYSNYSSNLFGVHSETKSKWLIYINSSGTVIANTSDIRYKENISNMPESDALSILREVDIINFSYKEDEQHIMQSGVSAQQLRDVVLKHDIKEHAYLTMGSAVEGDTNVYTDLTMPEEDVRYEVDYSKFVPILWKGWQYQDKRIRELEAEIDRMKKGMKAS